jgi:hypothetical protein
VVKTALVVPVIINTDSGCWHDQPHDHHTMGSVGIASTLTLSYKARPSFVTLGLG